MRKKQHPATLETNVAHIRTTLDEIDGTLTALVVQLTEQETKLDQISRDLHKLIARVDSVETARMAV